MYRVGGERLETDPGQQLRVACPLLPEEMFATNRGTWFKEVRSVLLAQESF